MLKIINKESASEQVASILADAIFRSEFRPGDLLPSIPELCEKLGVCRNTVRQGIARLAARGLVDVSSGKGTRVAELLESATIDTLIDLVLRSRNHERRAEVLSQLLEMLVPSLATVVELAAQRHAPAHLEWHAHFIRVLADRFDMGIRTRELAEAEIEIFRVLAGAAKNIGFTGLLNSLKRLVRAPHPVGTGAAPLMSLDSHWKLLELVRAHDSSGARELVVETIGQRRRRWIDEFAQAGASPVPPVRDRTPDAPDGE